MKKDDRHQSIDETEGQILADDQLIRNCLRLSDLNAAIGYCFLPAASFLGGPPLYEPIFDFK
jgi:hypothetical protein